MAEQNTLLTYQLSKTSNSSDLDKERADSGSRPDQMHHNIEEFTEISEPSKHRSPPMPITRESYSSVSKLSQDGHHNYHVSSQQ